MNLHATALVIGETGLLLIGPSGSGKTTLALELIARCSISGRFAALVADDQALVSIVGRRLIAAAPPVIAGLVEVRGGAPRPVRLEAKAVIDFAVKLVPTASAPRYADPASEMIAGVELPILLLQERNVMGALAAIGARLGLPPFV